MGKGNPYHDEHGKFTDAANAVTGSAGWTPEGAFHESLGIDRSDMPQIRAPDHEEFLQFAKDKGVEIAREKATVSDLKPAQKHFNPAQASQMPESALGYPLMVSKDNYVLDGTNRYVAILMKEPKRQIDIIRIGLPARDALKLMHSFPKAGKKSVAQVGSTSQVYGQILKANPYHDELGRFTFADKVSTAAEKTKTEIEKELAAQSGKLKYMIPSSARDVERKIKLEAIARNFPKADIKLMEKLGRDWSASSVSVGAMRERAAVIGLTSYSETEIEQRLAAENVPEHRTKDPKWEDDTRAIAYETAAGGPLSKYRAALEAIAATTQAFYPEEVTLYRGIGVEQTQKLLKAIEQGKEEVEISMGALSSWTEDRDTARFFAQNETAHPKYRDEKTVRGTILKLKAPRSCLFASWRSVGAHMREKEVVIASKGKIKLKVADLTLVDQYGLGEPAKKVSKANPYHDELGRFTFAEGATSAAEKTKGEVSEVERQFHAAKPEGDALAQVNAILEAGGSREAIRQMKLEALVKNFPGADISTLYEWGRAWSNSSTSKGAMRERAVVIGLMANSEKELDEQIAREMEGFKVARNIGEPAMGDFKEAEAELKSRALDTFERKNNPEDRGIAIASLEAMAAATQAHYPDPEVTLYRGIGYDQAKAIDEAFRKTGKSEIAIGLGALSSWSEDEETARQFGHINDGYVLKVKVPRESIVASWRSVGANEQEKEVVIASKGKVTVSTDNIINARDRAPYLTNLEKQPWYQKVKDIESDPQILKEVLAGEHDDLGVFEDGPTRQAVDFVKRRHKVSKFNPYHDEKGRFTHSDGSVSNAGGVKLEGLNVLSTSTWGSFKEYSPTERVFLKELRAAQDKYESEGGRLGIRVDQLKDAPPITDETMKVVRQMLHPFLQEEGEEYPVPSEPPPIRIRAPKQCFKNAAELVLESPEKYDYGEGVLIDSKIPIPIMHAWAIDKATGSVVDPTLGWVKNAKYIGVRFSREDMARHLLKNKVYGILDSSYELIEGKDKHFKYKAKKANPYHDEFGRFTFGPGASKVGGSVHARAYAIAKKFQDINPKLLKEWHESWTGSSTSQGALDEREIVIGLISQSEKQLDQELGREKAAVRRLARNEVRSGKMDGVLAKEVFKVKNGGTSTDKSIQKMMNTLSAMVATTQASYPPMVTLYRGVGSTQRKALERAVSGGGKITLAIGCLSSWTERKGVAQGFATEDEDDGAVITLKVPRSALVASWRSIGADVPEKEVVIASHGKITLSAKDIELVDPENYLKLIPVKRRSKKADYIEIFKEGRGNPYHDEQGRFTFAEHAVSTQSIAGENYKDAGLLDREARGHYERMNVELLLATREQWNSLFNQGLTDEVRNYSETSQINWSLGAIAADGGELSRGDKAIIDKLDDAIGQCTIPENIVVYRGANIRTFGFDLETNFQNEKYVKDDPERLKQAVGKDVKDPTYASSSLSVGAAEGFVNYRRVLMRLKVPKGSTGLYLGTRSELQHEYEVLLPRDSMYHIDGVGTYDDPLSGAKLYYLDATLLPRHRKVEKANPYHDELGRFTHGPGGSDEGERGSDRYTKSLVYQHGLDVWDRLPQRNRAMVIDYSANPEGYTESALDIAEGGTVDAKTTALDAAINESIVPLDFKVYRAVNVGTFGLDPDDGTYGPSWTSDPERLKHLVGKDFEDPIFASTSLNRDEAINFMNPRRLLMEVTVRKGSTALPISHASMAPSEEEVLLPRKSKYHVVGIGEAIPVKNGYGKGKVPVLKVELIPSRPNVAVAKFVRMLSGGVPWRIQSPKSSF